MKRLRVMVVEPDPRRRMELKRCLSLDFDVNCPPSVGEALTRFRRNVPDVLVTNYKLDGSRGPKLCRWLRMHSEDRSCLMVVVGEPGQRLRSKNEIQDIWKVDAFVPYSSGPLAISSVIQHELATRRRNACSTRDLNPAPPSEHKAAEGERRRTPRQQARDGEKAPLTPGTSQGFYGTLRTFLRRHRPAVNR